MVTASTFRLRALCMRMYGADLRKMKVSAVWMDSAGNE